MDLTEAGCNDVDWVHLDQDQDQWQVLVNIFIKGAEFLNWLRRY